MYVLLLRARYSLDKTLALLVVKQLSLEKKVMKMCKVNKVFMAKELDCLLVNVKLKELYSLVPYYLVIHSQAASQNGCSTR